MTKVPHFLCNIHTPHRQQTVSQSFGPLNSYLTLTNTSFDTIGARGIPQRLFLPLTAARRPSKKSRPPRDVTHCEGGEGGTVRSREPVYCILDRSMCIDSMCVYTFIKLLEMCIWRCMHIDEMNVSIHNICIACHVCNWFVNTSIPPRQMLPLHWKAAVSTPR